MGLHRSFTTPCLQRFHISKKPILYTACKSNGKPRFFLSTKAILDDNDSGAVAPVQHVDKVRQWSMDNEKVARAILNVPSPPSFSEYDEFDIHNCRSRNVFIEYLKWRKWGIDLSSKSIGTVTATDDSNSKMILALLSHTLTFPLTLGNSANTFLSQQNASTDNRHVNNNAKLESNTINNENPTNNKRVVRICCVGARAEANLPLDMWREMLILANLKSFHNKSRDHHTNTTLQQTDQSNENVHWIIDFIGPDVPSNMKSRSVSLDSMGKSHCIKNNCIHHESLTMNYYCGFLHTYILEMIKKEKSYQNEQKRYVNNRTISNADLLNFWNGFVLFNPGIGHVNLKKSWLPTLEFILKTNKKILTTAHSQLDSRRDLELWIELLFSKKKNCERTNATISYDMNPFASRMGYEDPFPPDYVTKNKGVHLVNPNHSMLIL